MASAASDPTIVNPAGLYPGPLWGSSWRSPSPLVGWWRDTPPHPAQLSVFGALILVAPRSSLVPLRCFRAGYGPALNASFVGSNESTHSVCAVNEDVDCVKWFTVKIWHDVSSIKPSINYNSCMRVRVCVSQTTAEWHLNPKTKKATDCSQSRDWLSTRCRILQQRRATSISNEWLIWRLVAAHAPTNYTATASLASSTSRLPPNYRHQSHQTLLLLLTIWSSSAPHFLLHFLTWLHFIDVFRQRSIIFYAVDQDGRSERTLNLVQRSVTPKLHTKCLQIGVSSLRRMLCLAQRSSHNPTCS